MMKVYCYARCSTCRKALTWLDEKGVEYELFDIKEQNPSLDQLKEWYEKSGLPLKKFFNTSGMIYRDMGLSKKLPEMNDEEQLALLSTDGMLVKRPLVIGDEFVLTGFKEPEWAEKVLK
ncbi:MAG: arsenate reductase family protein [Emergencia sp.]